MNVTLFTDEELNMLGCLLGQGVIQCKAIPNVKCLTIL